MAELPYAEELVDAGALVVLTREAHGIRPAGRLTAAELVPLWEPGQIGYVCGSASFAEAASQLLMSTGFAAHDIRVERFGPSGAACLTQAPRNPPVVRPDRYPFRRARCPGGRTAMPEDDALRRDLLWRIEARRASVQAFLRANRPRIRRRTTLVIVLSGLAALFTAGPAFGGETFATSVQNALGLASDSTVWRTLCLLAVIVSVGSAILTNLTKSQDDAGRLTAAEAANAEFEGLTSLVQFGQLTVPDAVKLYQQYSVKIPFVDEFPGAVGAGYGYGAPPPR